MSDISTLSKEFGFKDYEVIQTFEGGNSLVFQIRSENQLFAIKKYVGDESRKIRSLFYEKEALLFLNSNKLINCPELIAASSNIPAIAYKWIEGSIINESDSVKSAIFSTISKLAQPEHVKNYQIRAIDSVLNSAELIQQLKLRLKEFANVENFPEELLRELQDTFSNIQNLLNNEIEFNNKTLSLSDYGPHNLIRTDSGVFHHIDFEFFGVDSMAKMFSDLYCHPKTIFSGKEIRELMEINHMSNSENTGVFKILPAIALKWALIVLRRHVDWSASKFKLNESKYANPWDFLSYSKYLFKNINSDQTITFNEFVSH